MTQPALSAGNICFGLPVAGDEAPEQQHPHSAVVPSGRLQTLGLGPQAAPGSSFRPAPPRSSLVCTPGLPTALTEFRTACSWPPLPPLLPPPPECRLLAGSEASFLAPGTCLRHSTGPALPHGQGRALKGCNLCNRLP